MAAPLATCVAALVAMLATAARGEDAFLAEAAARNIATASDVEITSGESVARLCVAHGRDCTCPGCRAFYKACEVPCPPGFAPGVAPEALAEPGAPEAATPESDLLAEPEPQPMSGPMPSVSSSLGAVAAASSASPGMIGDFFGGGYQYAPGSISDSGALGPTVSVAGGDRILKFADNNSPIPQNRLFFNYHLFSNPVTDVNGVFQDVNRFTFGVEKTFWDGTTSLEFRVPFAAGVDNIQSVDQATSTLAAEFGNLALAAKMLIYQRGPWSVAGGMGIIFPTAEDAVILDNSGINELSRFANESFFLQPYLGAFYRPGPRLFSQFMAQANFDVTGSTFTYFGDSEVLHEQSLLFLDWSTGYWLYRARRCDSWLTGIAPMIELHYTTTMEDLELPNFDGNTVFVEDFRRDALNLTGGILLGLGDWTSLRVAGVAPLRDETLMYDAEFGVQLIHRY